MLEKLEHTPNHFIMILELDGCSKFNVQHPRASDNEQTPHENITRCLEQAKYDACFPKVRAVIIRSSKHKFKHDKLYKIWHISLET